MEDTKSKKKVKKKKPIKKAIKIFFITLLSIFVLIGVACAGIALAMIKTAPELNINQILTLNEPSVLYDDKGKYMDDVLTEEKRDIVSIKAIPENLKNAFVSIEDERFYSHKGIDLKRITGALIIDVKNKIKKQGGVQGASTITQQLVKTRMFLTDSLQNRLSIKRKVQEMYLAVQLEKHLSKDQILEAYMNTIYLGGKAHGVEAAAKQYFSKSVKDLTLQECAFIAGMSQAPSRYYPFSISNKKDPSTYINRTKTVLYKMYENNKITKQQYDEAVNQKFAFKPNLKNSNTMNYEWYSWQVIDQVKKDLEDQYHYSKNEINSLLMYGGLQIYTSMDRDLQINTQNLLNSDTTFGINSGKNSKGIIQPQAAAVIMDYHTGEVKAIVGGRGVQPAKSYNRAASSTFTMAPGSSIKPLTVYGPAIDTKMATAATVIEDSPVPVEIGKIYDPKKPYNPKNSPDKYYGYLPLREALMHSVNVVAVKLEHQIGLNTGAAYAEKFGIKLHKADKTSIAALSLGQLTKGTTPLIMTSAYGVFGNNGIKTTPTFYKKVVDRSGKVLLEYKPITKRVLSPQSAYIIYDMLKGPVSSEGTGPNAVFGDMPVRGKTGTSSEKIDLWFCGLTPYYSAAVWVGNDDHSVVNGLNSNSVAGVWGKIMSYAHKNLQVKDIQMPSGIVQVAVCKDSGNIPTDLSYKDPRGNRVYNELFIEGTQPTALDDIHVLANINKLNGKLATPQTPPELIEPRVFIKRNYIPSVFLADSPYVLPRDLDDTVPIKPPTENSNSNNNNNSNSNNSVSDIIDKIINNNKGNTDTNPDNR